MRVVETKEEFDELIRNYQLSNAPMDLKDNAIRELKALNPEFNDEVDKLPTAELAEDMKASESDTSDMGGY